MMSSLLTQLVEYLTRPFKTQMEKTRVLFRYPTVVNFANFGKTAKLHKSTKPNSFILYFDRWLAAQNLCEIDMDKNAKEDTVYKWLQNAAKSSSINKCFQDLSKYEF